MREFLNNTIYFFGDVTEGEKIWWHEYIKCYPEFNRGPTYTITIVKEETLFSLVARIHYLEDLSTSDVQYTVSFGITVRTIHYQLQSIFGEIG